MIGIADYSVRLPKLAPYAQNCNNLIFNNIGQMPAASRQQASGLYSYVSKT